MFCQPRYGVKNIYLATDDFDIIDETKEWPDFNWMFAPYATRGNNETLIYSDEKLRNGALNNFELAESTLIDIFLLSQGDYFVGKFTSNIDRIAYARMCGVKGGLVPYISLDSVWCFDFGVKSGNSTYGPFSC